ncbi:putative Isoleucine--tRNA ligase [Paratrimastix pyriformis]|uniref:isoleucine--tRNA ligase n=1 Tax=Paratrimastix pyriformis TaxID=342808 RepID=A0ABQ8UWE3_9EUKA|nr:putative Isoleucine--tRNA ligase [Paratrimastix pyriformis]
MDGDIAERHSFPQEEEKILSYWKEIDAFKESLRLSEGKPEYSFYDGPPFATGLPHYGHILAGTIKDVVTRYFHMCGHHIVRRFGWDTHGLPVEYEIDQHLKIKSRSDVTGPGGIGIAAYNAECRKIVMRYANEWRHVVERMGRWIDFDNDYKTLQPTYMESVWWVFRQLFDQGLVYRGVKVMPFSTATQTPLSNFEAGQNYKDVQDPAVIISFPLVEEPEASFLAWTTTPWTLPSNLALCVNAEFDYVKIRDASSGKVWVLAESRLSELYKTPQEYTVISKCKGADLRGKRYVPLFPYFAQMPNVHQVICDSYVTSDSGTGIVHCAPYFGEDDNRVCLAGGIIQKEGPIVCPIDDRGCFTAEVPEYQGLYVKDADKVITRKLKEMGRLVHQGTITHQYPFCYRSETPLIYKAVPSWFIDVPKVKARLVANNAATYWVPDWVKEKRFHNWLQDAREWAVSRNRFWGTPIPLWVSSDFEEVICVGSVEELKQLSGRQDVTDLHRENIDPITIPSRKGKGDLHRVEEVFDCWFESGSMPYAQLHYPFENQELFERSFPADFIAEGVDQTRGWFYTLMVLSTALRDKPAFKNLIVNGLVLASDGRKMSKRLRNYPDPLNVVSQYGADALRLFLINSPVVHAENLRFKEEGVQAVVKEVFLPWYNGFRFFLQNSARFAKEVGPIMRDAALAYSSTNAMDRWVLAASSSLLQFVQTEMHAYRLSTVVPRLLRFIDDLTNWYVRFNRKRLKGSKGPVEWRTALCTLYEPEGERLASIHFYPQQQPRPVTAEEARNQEAVERMQKVILLGRSIREKHHVSLKNPLRSVVVLHADPSSGPTWRAWRSTSRPSSTCTSLHPAEIDAFQATGKATVCGYELAGDDIKVIQEFEGSETVKHASEDNPPGSRTLPVFGAAQLIVLLDMTVDQQLLEEGFARSLINRVQKLRKRAALLVEDEIEVYVSFEVPPKPSLDPTHSAAPAGAAQAKAAVQQAVANRAAFIREALAQPVLPKSAIPAGAVVLAQAVEEVGGAEVEITLVRLGPDFPAQTPEGVRAVLSSMRYPILRQQATAGPIRVRLDGRALELVRGRDFFLSTAERLAL